eukprot:11759557-Alexandrium_andersonii.AAC.1
MSHTTNTTVNARHELKQHGKQRKLDCMLATLRNRVRLAANVKQPRVEPVSYTHLRAHETSAHL